MLIPIRPGRTRASLTFLEISPHGDLGNSPPHSSWGVGRHSGQRCGEGWQRGQPSCNITGSQESGLGGLSRTRR